MHEWLSRATHPQERGLLCTLVTLTLYRLPHTLMLWLLF